MNTQARLERLERAADALTGTRPPYIAVKDESELEAMLDDPGLAAIWPVKVYIGCSPDDWDTEGATGHDENG